MMIPLETVIANIKRLPTGYCWDNDYGWERAGTVNKPLGQWVRLSDIKRLLRTLNRNK